MSPRLSVLLAVTLIASAVPAAAAAARPDPPQRPIVFVHGFSGSGLQFETQAKRFASNGYRADLIEAHDYDSTLTVQTAEQVHAELDRRIARLLAATGADRVDLIGHSRGTAISQDYLASPARAATVAHYINLDGRPATAPPGGVPTLAVWAEGNSGLQIAGAANAYFPDQSHTQVVTSPESFIEMFRFLTGRAPRTTEILPQPPGRVVLAGRALLFPINVGVTGARLEIYEIGVFTGARRTGRPEAVFPLSGDGSWGPFRANGFARYEFAIVRDGAATHHLYFPPFGRTDRLVRLLTSLPGQGLAALMETSDRHTNLVISRNKEWWGDQGTGSDALYLNGTNVLTAGNSPRTNRVIGIFGYDRGVDGVTDLSAPIPVFFAQPFLTGIDVYLPAAPAHSGIVSVVARSRTGGLDVLNVPNWPSSTHRISIQLTDAD